MGSLTCTTITVHTQTQDRHWGVCRVEVKKTAIPPVATSVQWKWKRQPFRLLQPVYSGSEKDSHSACCNHCTVEVKKTAILPVASSVQWKWKRQPFCRLHPVYSGSEKDSHSACCNHCTVEVKKTALPPVATSVQCKWKRQPFPLLHPEVQPQPLALQSSSPANHPQAPTSPSLSEENTESSISDSDGPLWPLLLSLLVFLGMLVPSSLAAPSSQTPSTIRPLRLLSEAASIARAASRSAGLMACYGEDEQW